MSYLTVDAPDTEDAKWLGRHGAREMQLNTKSADHVLFKLPARHSTGATGPSPPPQDSRQLLLSAYRHQVP